MNETEKAIKQFKVSKIEFNCFTTWTRTHLFLERMFTLRNALKRIENICKVYVAINVTIICLSVTNLFVCGLYGELMFEESKVEVNEHTKGFGMLNVKKEKNSRLCFDIFVNAELTLIDLKVRKYLLHNVSSIPSRSKINTFGFTETSKKCLNQLKENSLLRKWWDYLIYRLAKAFIFNAGQLLFLGIFSLNDWCNLLFLV